MSDYKNATPIKSEFVVNEKGYILFYGLKHGEGQFGFINNVRVFYYSHVANAYNGCNICIYPVSIGDVVTFNEKIETSFIPEIK